MATPNKPNPHFRTTWLALSDRPHAVYTYYVMGMGAFPLSMLRYDSCYPACQEDVEKINESQERISREMRIVEITSYREPTVERWNSFGWSVNSYLTPTMKDPE